MIATLIIDPQNSFVLPSGELSVTGAQEDMERTSEFIKKHGDKIDHIEVTLDSHHSIDIAHPIYVMDQDGKHPDPFTFIRPEDVDGVDAKFRAFNPSWQEWFVSYTKKLGGYMIWNPHCLIGSEGAAVYEPLFRTLVDFENKGFNVVNYTTKGSNLHTEHFGALEAEVPRDDDDSTQMNTDFVDKLRVFDNILLTGEAGSHCMLRTLQQLVSKFGEDQLHKFVWLEDTTSSIAGFEQQTQDFLKDYASKGLRIAKTTNFFD